MDALVCNPRGAAKCACPQAPFRCEHFEHRCPSKKPKAGRSAVCRGCSDYPMHAI
ncbi:hypothetical protein LY76DRAFT_595931 [Colletotrichum caudatum]|nr:hypothetical protein LY76DRAFT_595931 [Colletotrichum caudatum]